MIRQDESYGIVPLRQAEHGLEVLIIQHAAGHWGFPKGHKEPGEKTLDTVKRELKEETGLEVAEFLALRPYAENYEFKDGETLVNKLVFYYPAKVEGTLTLSQPHEVVDAKWVPLREAASHLTHIQSKIVALDTMRDHGT
jgi:8-oxo-dGTP pyrophosphatase MutT (NUDIX family)